MPPKKRPSYGRRSPAAQRKKVQRMAKREELDEKLLAELQLRLIKDEEAKLKQKLRKRIEEKSQDSSDASVREVKRMRKLNPLPKKAEKHSRSKYDENGLDKDTGLDVCDCLVEDCPGCWMDCPKCKSRKCGHECRRFRRFRYEYVEIEGADMTIRNKYK